jgi:hypothetical protein
MDLSPNTTLTHRALPSFDVSNSLLENIDPDETNPACALNLSKSLSPPPNDPMLGSTPDAVQTLKASNSRYATAVQLTRVEVRLLEAMSGLTNQVKLLQERLTRQAEVEAKPTSDTPLPARKKRKSDFVWADEPTPSRTPASPESIDGQLAEVRRLKQQEHDRLTSSSTQQLPAKNPVTVATSDQGRPGPSKPAPPVFSSCRNGKAKGPDAKRGFQVCFQASAKAGGTRNRS